MAGSLNHIVDDDGSFRFSTIENLGDAYECAQECHAIIGALLTVLADRSLEEMEWDESKGDRAAMREGLRRGHLREVCLAHRFPVPGAPPTDPSADGKAVPR